ncbi:MAG TPA: 4Fe-4S dicluster domain-containing protein [Zeimonas sp.]|nr:4Fe-4S dicluster domain-containing protein [Zeimonas sp.]
MNDVVTRTPPQHSAGGNVSLARTIQDAELDRVLGERVDDYTPSAAPKSASHTPRWGMVIDLNRCVGCQTCTIACKHANDTTPGVQWRRVLDVEQGSFPNVERLFLVTGCQHCAEPPCVPVCPTGATRQREDGLVTMNYDVCIGCAYCAVSCPYNARTIVHEMSGYYGKQRTKQEKATEHPERIGVAQKCTFCVDRVDAGLAKGRVPGVDPEATPACAAACISQAIQFGDFNDPDSNVSRLTRERESLQLNADVGTDPQIRYLYTTPAVPGREASDEDLDDERRGDPANPLVGPRQTFWDWRAAMNWIFGGVGTGLALTGTAAMAVGALATGAGRALFFVSAALVAIGLFCVFLKIGRQMRFWRAATRWQSSWMTRELYAALVFFPSVLAVLVAPGPVSFGFAAVSAAAFLFCQAKILHLARGIPAWRVARMPWMLIATGLLEGAGALAVVVALLDPALRAPSWVSFASASIVVLAALNATLWRGYVGSARENGIPPLSRRVLEAFTPRLHAMGHAVPVVLAILAWLLPSLAPVLLALAGLAAIAGGAGWKYTVIVRAAYMQGFDLRKMPQRGSGRYAAPPRMDPAKMPRPADARPAERPAQ